MEFHDANYDFSCGKDLKTIRLAVEHDGFHSIKIQAEIARVINLSGGTKAIEIILMVDCKKVSRIVWPAYTGNIKYLKINGANSLTHLDISPLANLEELSIINCSELTEIVGIGERLRTFNVHGTKIREGDVAHAKKNLETYNVSTNSASFSANLTDFDALKSISIETKSHSVADTNVERVICQVNGCPNLKSMNIVTGDVPAAVNIKSCPNLLSACFSCGDYSEVIGIAECEKLEFFYKREDIHTEMDDASAKYVKKIQEKYDDVLLLSEKVHEMSEAATKFKDKMFDLKPRINDTETVIQHNVTLREGSSDCFVKISLLSMPHQDFGHAFKNDVSHMLSFSQQTPHHLLHDARFPVVYITALTQNEEAKQLLSGARQFSENDGNWIAWLENKGNKHPNLLLLDKKYLHNPMIRHFLDGVMHRKHLFLYTAKGTKEAKEYHITAAHKVVIVGKPDVLQHVPQLHFTDTPQAAHVAQFGDEANKLVFGSKAFVTKMQQEQYQRMMMETYLRINALHPLADLSLTDVNDMTQRFLTLANQVANLSVNPVESTMLNPMPVLNIPLNINPISGLEVSSVPSHQVGAVSKLKTSSISPQQLDTDPQVKRSSGHEEDPFDSDPQLARTAGKETAPPESYPITAPGKQHTHTSTDDVMASGNASLTTDKPTDDQLHSAPAKVESLVAPIPHYVEITRSKQHVVPAVEQLTQIKPSQATLDTDIPAVEPPLSSKRISVKDEAATDNMSTASEDQAEAVVADLLNATKALGMVLKKLSDAAKTATSSEKPYPASLATAEKMLDDSLQKLPIKASAAAVKTPGKSQGTSSANVLHAAEEVAAAMAALTQACKVELPSPPAPTTPAKH